MTTGVGGFSYDLGVFPVVENQPVSLEWATIVKPIQAWWFSQWLATLALIVGKWLFG
ncbi:hypothetical protein ACFLWL_03245 [Chloroflexota bacterium]